MKIFKYIPFFLCLLLVNEISAQGIYLDPSPTDVTSAVRLYVDISSPECNCPNVQDVGPDEPLFIWTWLPNEARPPLFGETVTNGEWTNSNPNLEMTQDADDPNLWYFDFLGASPAQFYDAPPAAFYEGGIHFLVKKRSGAGDPEPKSPDLNVIPEPIGCVEVICPFPITFFQDEYVIFTYDNNIEPNATLQNLGPTECYATFRYRVNGGPEQSFPSDPGSADPEMFRFDYDGEGIFSYTMIPQDFLPLNEGDQLTQMRVFITKLPLPAPPFSISTNLEVGCPE